MKLITFINWIIEFGPIILFFIALKIFGESGEGFIIATALFTGATFLSLLFAYIRDKRIALFPVVSGIFVVLFGLTTIYFKQPYIFVIKDTIYNALFAIVLFVGLIKNKGYLKTLFASLFDMKDEGWKILSKRWMIFFVILAVSNEIIWRNFSLNVWVMYKFYATITTTIFGSYQIILTKKYRNKNATLWGLRKVNFNATSS